MPPRSAQDQKLQRLRGEEGGGTHPGPLLLLAPPQRHTESTPGTWALPPACGYCAVSAPEMRSGISHSASQAPTSLCEDPRGRLRHGLLATRTSEHPSSSLSKEFQSPPQDLGANQSRVSSSRRSRAAPMGNRPSGFLQPKRESLDATEYSPFRVPNLQPRLCPSINLGVLAPAGGVAPQAKALGMPTSQPRRPHPASFPNSCQFHSGCCSSDPPGLQF